MCLTAPRIRNLRLTATDALFDGREARFMRQLLGMEPDFGDQPLRRSSIKEQMLLAETLDRSGRFPEALAGAASLGLRDFGVAGLAVLFAPTVQDVERSLRNFAPLLNLRHDVTLRRSDEGLQFELGLPAANADAGARCLRMLDVAKLDRFLRDLLDLRDISRTQEEVPVRQQCTVYPVPRQPQELFPLKNLTQHRRHEKAARKAIKELEHAHLGAAVRRLLIAGAGAGDRLPELADLARQLGYSPRTLRRRLAERGTSFLDCVNDVRHQLALSYLATTNFTVDAIAERLGYSDTSNFRHAFRRWTGVSPKAYVVRASADLPVTLMRTHRGGPARASAAQRWAVSVRPD